MNKNVGADKDKFTISCYGIKLPFEWYSMKTMVDRFGEDVTTLAYDMTSFRVQTEVSASPTFFGWVFGFNGKVQILAPESVKEQYRQMIAKADEDMQESEQSRFEFVQTVCTNQVRLNYKTMKRGSGYGKRPV